VSRNPSGYLKLLKDQYELLKDAVDGFYAGNTAKANDAAIRIRTLVHNTEKSKALLSLVAENYMELPIYHRANTNDHPDAVFVLKQPFVLSRDGTFAFIRDDFSNPDYTLVPLERWWTEEYLIIGAIRSSKKQIVHDLANKDGGAHVDPEVPLRHAAASEPPMIIGLHPNAVRPNLARGTVAQAGNELLDYIERHFPTVVEPENRMADSRVQGIQSRLQVLKDSASQLERTIVDEEARESLLRLATYLLADVERFVLPQALKAGNPIDASRWSNAAELQLKSAQEQLTRAQDMVSKYGPNLRVIGG